MLKLGYLGPRGSFSEQSANIFKKLYNNYNSQDEEIKIIPFETIPVLLMAVANNNIDLSITPIENLIEGPVSSTLDILAREESLYINCDFPLKINHFMMVKPGYKGDINTIISHPQSIGQCSDFIFNNYPNSTIIYSKSNSDAAKLVSESTEMIAAIAPFESSILYNLEIIHKNIQDNKSNYTRFVCISRDINLLNNSFKFGSYKTSIVFSTQNNPGSLYKILSIFNLWDINLIKIESRPTKTSLGEYMFFVDIEGSTDDCNINDALKMVKRKTSFFKLLGSFPSSSSNDISLLDKR